MSNFSNMFTKIIRKINPQYGYRESDTIIASFPKSGRNWVRFLLANSIVVKSGKDIDIHFKNSSKWISTTEPKSPPTSCRYPRIVSDHDEYKGQATNVVYIVRHPADVMESFYVYKRDRWNVPVGKFSDFIRSNEWGIKAWSSHVKSWCNVVDVLVKFEELKKDAGKQLRNIYRLFDEDIDHEEVQKAVERSSFENMARMEEKYGLPEKNGADPNFRFMRKGEASKGEEYFNKEDYRYLRSIAGNLIDELGYDTPL